MSRVDLEVVMVVMPPEQEGLFWEAVRILLQEVSGEGFLIEFVKESDSLIVS